MFMFTFRSMKANFTEFHSPAELQHELAVRLRDLRISKQVTQDEIASKTRLSRNAIRRLETIGQASVSTLIRYLHALDAGRTLDAIAPRVAQSPIALFRQQSAAPRQRVRKPTKT